MLRVGLNLYRGEIPGQSQVRSLSGGSLGAPRPACGERSDCIEDAIGVRGTLREAGMRGCPSPQPSPRKNEERERTGCKARAWVPLMKELVTNSWRGEL
ncbi:hypothetical protein BRAO375_2450008 [Bradyrhizobium sp. ORS 375]|nr:hypothetical protein BRAO375_2450008 [Bradyrhizobium sp. ORS 375]